MATEAKKALAYSITEYIFSGDGEFENFFTSKKNLQFEIMFVPSMNPETNIFSDKTMANAVVKPHMTKFLRFFDFNHFFAKCVPLTKEKYHGVIQLFMITIQKIHEKFDRSLDWLAPCFDIDVYDTTYSVDEERKNIPSFEELFEYHIVKYFNQKIQKDFANEYFICDEKYPVKIDACNPSPTRTKRVGRPPKTSGILKKPIGKIPLKTSKSKKLPVLTKTIPMTPVVIPKDKITTFDDCSDILKLCEGVSKIELFEGVSQTSTNDDDMDEDDL